MYILLCVKMKVNYNVIRNIKLFYLKRYYNSMIYNKFKFSKSFSEKFDEDLSIKSSIINKTNKDSDSLDYNISSSSTNNSYTYKYLKETLIKSNKDENTEIVNLQIDNSKNRNSLNIALISELSLYLNNIKEINSQRVVILSTAGKIFSSGHDLKEFHYEYNDSIKSKQIFDLCSNMMLNIKNSPCVFISEIQGLATAAGLQLALACDLSVASSTAGFCLPGVKIGLVPLTPAICMNHNFKESNKMSFEMLTKANVVSADEAYNKGIINKIVKKYDDEKEEDHLTKLREVSIKYANDVIENKGVQLKREIINSRKWE